MVDLDSLCFLLQRDIFSVCWSPSSKLIVSGLGVFFAIIPFISVAGSGDESLRIFEATLAEEEKGECTHGIIVVFFFSGVFLDHASAISFVDFSFARGSVVLAVVFDFFHRCQDRTLCVAWSNDMRAEVASICGFHRFFSPLSMSFFRLTRLKRSRVLHFRSQDWRKAGVSSSRNDGAVWFLCFISIPLRITPSVSSAAS